MEYSQNQTSNLYSEDDFLRNAAGKNFRAKGFDRKIYNEAINAKKEKLADSAIGGALPACYYNLDDSFSGGGAMPPPRGVYYQTGQSDQPAQKPESPYQNPISSLMDSFIGGIKDGLYIGMVQLPLIVRNGLMARINKLGTIPNFLSSIYAMGVDSGCIQRELDDFKYDRLELILNPRDEIIGIRTYNTRPETSIVKFLRKGRVKPGEPLVPRKGQPVKNEDITFAEKGGLIARYKLEQCGGLPLREGDIKYDPSNVENDTERWETHGESKRGVSVTGFRENILKFTLAHYAQNIGTADVQDIGEHEYTKEKLRRVTLPYSYGLHKWDGQLAVSTGSRLVATYMTHFLYNPVEKLFEKMGLQDQAKTIAKLELDSSYIPFRPPIVILGY